MKIDRNSQIKRTRSAMETVVGNEIVLMVLESGNVYGLGDTGSAVWRLIAEPTRVDRMVEELVQEYDAPRDLIESDVLELLEEMRQRELIAVA